MLALLFCGLLLAAGCPDEEPIVPPPEAIDRASLPPVPEGPPKIRADGKTSGAGLPTAKLTAAAEAELAAIAAQEQQVRHDGWTEGRALAAGLVPLDVSGALLVASVGGLLDSVGSLMGELESVGVHSRFDVGYADGLRRALGTSELGGEALRAEGLVSRAPAALWWREDAWVVLLPLTEAGLPGGMLERGMSIRAGWPGSPCKLGRAAAGELSVTTCQVGGHVSLFAVVRGDRLLLGGADDLRALRRAVTPTRQTLLDSPERTALPDVEAPVELFARGLSALWSGSLRVGLQIEAGGVFARGRVTSETLLIAEGPAPFENLEAIPSTLTLRARLRGAGQLVSALGVSAAFRALCRSCTSAADREAEAELTDLLGGEVALLLRKIDPGLLRAKPGGKRLPPEVAALAGFEQLWLARVSGPLTEAGVSPAQEALDALLARMRRGGVIVEPVPERGASRAYRLRRLRGPGAPLEAEIGLTRDRLYLATGTSLAALQESLPAEPAEASSGPATRGFVLRLDPAQLANAVDPEQLPDPPTSLAEALLVYGLELARSAREPPPWRIELWPEGEAGLNLQVSLPSPSRRP